MRKLQLQKKDDTINNEIKILSLLHDKKYGSMIDINPMDGMSSIELSKILSSHCKIYAANYGDNKKYDKDMINNFRSVNCYCIVRLKLDKSNVLDEIVEYSKFSPPSKIDIVRIKINTTDDFNILLLFRTVIVIYLPSVLLSIDSSLTDEYNYNKCYNSIIKLCKLMKYNDPVVSNTLILLTRK